MVKTKITIQGMHCASCASNIERSLKKIEGVKNANVSLMMKKGYIESDKKIDEKEIKKAVEKVGYKVNDIEEEE